MEERGAYRSRESWQRVSWAINSSGQVVGASTVSPGTVHAFLWEKGTGIVDLNDLIPPGSGFFLEDAFYLNDRGQIAGHAILDNGEDRAYLLTPCEDGDHPGDCRSDTVSAEASAGLGSRARVRAASGDESVTGLSDLRRQLAERHHFAVRSSASSE